VSPFRIDGFTLPGEDGRRTRYGSKGDGFMRTSVDAGLEANGAASGAARGRGRRATALLAAGLLLAAAGCDRFKAKQLVREGNAYFKEQLYEDALRKYDEARALDPNEIRFAKFVAMGNMALYNPGSTHPKDLEVLKKAIENFKLYLEQRPEDEKAAKYLITTYMNAGKFDDAIEKWRENHPADHQAVQTIAMLYARKGDFENSMTWQKERAKLEPGNPDVFYTMGVTCWDKAYNTPPERLDGDKRKEIVDFGMAQLQKALELRPDYFEAMFYVNLLYREMAKLENDVAKKAELKTKADEWQKKGLEVRARVIQKQKEEAAAKNPLDAL
jgi:tetratricopeptide (TPR) repeat protein